MMAQQHYARRLGTFSATLIVVGGIIGAGIFLSPAMSPGGWAIPP